MSTAVETTFAALGDPVRRAIVHRLSDGDATVGELAGLFAVTFQAVSQQIATLERAGLVTRHREGRTRRVQLEPAAIDQAAGWLEARRERLEQRYLRLDAVLSEQLHGGPGDRLPGSASTPTEDETAENETTEKEKR